MFERMHSGLGFQVCDDDGEDAQECAGDPAGVKLFALRAAVDPSEVLATKDFVVSSDGCVKAFLATEGDAFATLWAHNLVFEEWRCKQCMACIAVQ